VSTEVGTVDLYWPRRLLIQVAIARQVVGASMLGKKIEPVSGGVAQEGNGERNRS